MMRQKFIAALTAGMMLLQLLSLPAAALYEQAADGLALAPPAASGAERRDVGEAAVEETVAVQTTEDETVDLIELEEAMAAPTETEAAETVAMDTAQKPAGMVLAEQATSGVILAEGALSGQMQHDARANGDEAEYADTELAERLAEGLPLAAAALYSGTGGFRPTPVRPTPIRPTPVRPRPDAPESDAVEVAAGAVEAAADEAAADEEMLPLAWDPYTWVTASFGLNVAENNGYLFDCAPATGTGANFRVEIPTEDEHGTTIIMNQWLPGWLVSGALLTTETDAAVLDFADLSNPGDVRVPDKQFEGWYVFPDAPAISVKRDWRFSDICTDKVVPDVGGTTLRITEDFATFSSAADGRLLPLVARWADSDEAHLRKEYTVMRPMRGAVAGDAITAFYDSDIATDAVDGVPTIAFSPDVYEYYLRVDSDVTTLGMTLATFEPYHSYFANNYASGSGQETSPVKAVVTYGTETLNLTGGLLGGNAMIMPKPTTVGAMAIPMNTRINPARAEWKLNVPLFKSAGLEKLYNDLVITITAPDGVTEATYTFHIQRLAEPVMKLNPGNTPFGMIERDTSPFWVNQPELKEAAKAYFRDYRAFNFAAGQYPMDTIHNNGGSLMRGSYDNRAWGVTTGATNYDMDPTAIVVYQDSAFLDPGIAGLTNTIGVAKEIDGVVKRTIKLRTAEKLTLDLIRKNSGDTVYYQTSPGGGALVSVETADTLTTVNGGGAGDVVDLRGLPVLPGVYSIEYSYEDAASGKTYSSDPDGFASDKDNAKTFKRTLIIMPIRGDIDMDGMVTPADAAALRTLGGLTGSTTETSQLNNIAVGGSGAAADPVVDFMFYRVCDTDGNNQCNLTDAQSLQDGYLPQLARGTGSDYYYIPLPDGGAAYQRAVLTESETASSTAGQLTLQYLGTQKGEKNAQGYYPTSPADPIYDGNVSADDRVEQGDIFWVGVKLDNVEQSGMMGSKISAFTMTLTYDSNYVEPVDVLDTNDAFVGAPEVWYATMLKYNIGAKSHTIWGSSTQYEAPGSKLQKNRAFLTNYTKAITPLEESVPASGLREIVFSIQLRSGGLFTAAELKDGWLLVAPFKLVQFPYDQEDPVLVEMGAGMREFIFTGDGAMASMFSPMSGEFGEEESTLHGVGTATAAYSGQAAIYGGVTRNLRDKIKYTEGVGTAIPLGADNAPATLLKNSLVSGGNADATYGELFQSQFIGGLLQAGDTLPEGLSYGSDTSYAIRGTPAKAGDYTFRINRVKYRIVVKPAEVRFYANNQRSYYGQPEFRGTTGTDFLTSYSYHVDDIKSPDLARISASVQNDGKGNSLYALLGSAAGKYTQPQFCAVVDAAAETLVPVTAQTKIGEYPIICPDAGLPTAANYKFIFVNEPPVGTASVNRLTIAPRPVTVSRLTLDTDAGEYVGEIFDDSNEYITTTAEFSSAGKRQFALDLVSTSGTYGGIPLTGAAIVGADKLSIHYRAEFLRNAGDSLVGPIGKKFDITDAKGWELRETKIALISAVQDTEETYKNYLLVQGTNGTPTGVQDPMVYGKVKAQIISAIEITGMPAKMDYDYGNYLGSGAIQFRLVYASGKATGDIELNEISAASYHITAIWLTEEEMELAKISPTTSVGSEEIIAAGATPIGDANCELNLTEALTPAKQDGRYLCLSIKTWDASSAGPDGTMDSKFTRAYSSMLTVKKRVVTITIAPAARFYGEENPTEFKFTYPVGALLTSDRQGSTGAGNELRHLAGWREPTFEVVEALTGPKKLVTRDTPVSVNNYYVVGSGIEAANYDFVYAEGTSGATSTERGYATFTIQRRPVVVQGINSSVSTPKAIGTVDGAITTSYQPTATGVDLATIYSDSKVLTVSTTTTNTNCQYNGNTLRLSDGDFTVGLPTNSTSGTSYYPSGSSEMQQTALTFATGAPAVVGSDDLTLTYTATFVPDMAHYLDQGITKNYFDMTQADPDTGMRYCDIQISNMRLTGAAAGNYQLAYQRSDDAVKGYPYERVFKQAPRLDWNDSPIESYYVSGHGVLRTRAIESVELVSLPQMTYTYGDQFAPTQPNQGGSAPLTIQLRYATAYDNIAGNAPGESVSFNVYGTDVDGKLKTNFRDRRMEIRYLPIGETDVTNSLLLEAAEYLTVSAHNGVQILVAGRRSDSDPLTYSQPSTARLTVNKKDIPVVVQDQSRYYGERNANYTFTFKRADLALPDRTWLAGTEGSCWAVVNSDGPAVNLPATEGTLKGKGGYTGAQFTTTAQKTSNAASGIDAYTLKLAIGSMDNYRLVPTGDAKIYVYPRPVVVTDISSSVSAPMSIGLVDGATVTSYQAPGSVSGVNLATVYADTKSLVVDAAGQNVNVQYNKNTLKLSPTLSEFSAALPTHSTSGTEYYMAGSGNHLVNSNLSFAAGAPAVVGADELALTYTATFVPEKAFNTGLTSNYFDMTQADANTGVRYCDVQVSNMKLTGSSAANYQLVYLNGGNAAGGYPHNRIAKRAPQLSLYDTPTVYYYVSGHGTLRTRPIANLSIATLPQMTYTYGEQFAPNKPKPGSSVPLSIQVNYETTYDNVATNITGERLVYDSTLFRDRFMELRYLPSGVTDATQSKPITLGEYLTVRDHNNGRLIVAGKRFPLDAVKYTPASAEPIVVYKKNLPIIAQSQHRYYGERNANYTFTFKRTDLAQPDRGWFTGAEGSCWAVVNDDGPAVSVLATEGSLNGRGGYVGAQFTTAAQTSANAAIGTEAYLLRLDPGSMDNYNLVPTGEARIFVYQRPVVVTGIASSVSAPTSIGLVGGTTVTSNQAPGSVSGLDLATVYADTKRLVVDAAAQNANVQYNRNTLKLSPVLNEFSAALPSHTTTGTEYYAAGSGSRVTSNMTFAGGAAPVVGGDELALTYTATFVPETAFNTGLTDHYFDMTQADANTGMRYCDVQVSDMKLVGASAANYQLVYDNGGNALGGYPRNRVEKQAPTLGVSAAPTANYYVSGHGVLLTRPINDMSIATLPQMTYTYGEQFAPNLPNGGGSVPLSIQVNYKTTYDNVDTNITEERLIYDSALFSDRFMQLRYLPSGVSDASLSIPVSLGEYLTVREHNNGRLIVAGRRFPLDAVTYTPASAEPLIVHKKNLPIATQDQHRYYGERNADYTFTFAKADLAVPDRGWFADAVGSCWAVVDNDDPATGLPAAEGDLKGRGGYVAPQFTTTAHTMSDVRNSGNDPYTLTVAGGSMDNYNLVPTNEPGEIYIYRRPIKVVNVISSKENPIFGVYSDTAERVFDSDTDLNTLPPVLPVAAGQTFDNSTDDPAFQSGAALALTGDAVMPGDYLTFGIKVTYPDYDSGVLEEYESVFMDVHVTSVELNWNAGAGKNYCLLPDDYQLPAIGLVELRSIQSIRLTGAVEKTEYQYPEALDLGGVDVEITYVNLVSEQTNVVQVRYISTAQYGAYGLYMRYTDRAQAPETYDEMNALFQDGRNAETGDHLTIAPTHDTQGGVPFTPNGKYVTVIARRHSEQNFANALIVNPDAPIQVTPLPIQFALVADEKTYDGTTRAVGTLTMENIYHERAAVDRFHPEGVTDVVFVRTGAENQIPAPGYDASDHNGFEALKNSIEHEGYRFMSGTYVRDEDNRLSDHLEFTGGVYGGINNDRLTFAFTEQNVAYLVPPEHDNYGALDTIEVEAYNLILDGPDAANYTLVTAVDGSNYADAVGYQGEALPAAVINKAARPALTDTLRAGGNTALAAILPILQLDEQTNVVRMEYDMLLEPFAIAHDEHKDEDHFEFALQYVGADGGARIGQWAGQDGQQGYQDTRFFGGEFITVDVPEDYRADPRTIPTGYDPEKDILRGQRYGWAEIDPDVSVYLPAYLRAAADGGALNEIPYPNYEVYQGTRFALPRDTVFWGLVRLAETHNYEASPALSSVAGMEDELVTADAEATDALNAAWAAFADGEITQAQLQQAEQSAATAAQALIASAAQTTQAVKQAAEERSGLFAAIAEDGKWPEDGIPPLTPGAAVKTFRQRLDIISTATERSFGVSGSASYIIPSLEAVWFTDILAYPDKRLFDAVLRNIDPIRYYDFFWDRDFTAQLKLTDKQNPFTLEEAFEVEVTERIDGQSKKVFVTVNEEPVDGVPTVNTARIYAEIEPPNDGINLRKLRIIPDTVTARLGDYPLQLVVEFVPTGVKRKTLKWSTSDPAVVTVNEHGLLTFTGIGAAVVTAEAYNGKTATATVTVLEEDLNSPAAWDRQMMETYQNAIFNFALQTPFLALDEAELFYPEREMTRGDLAIFIAEFYRENPNWTRRGNGNFPDLTGGEDFAEAARLMGELGVMNGVDGGIFAGERKVTRAELATVLARMIYMEVPDTTGQPHAFADAGEQDTWAYSYIDALSRLKVVEGVGDGLFRPERKVIRAEAATMVGRLLRRAVDPDGAGILIPIDVGEDYWAYLSILRAINGETQTIQAEKESN